MDNLSLKLQINERDGLIHAIKSHNLALMERVQDLAMRVEGHVYKERIVLKLKNELESKCYDYQSKKELNN